MYGPEFDVCSTSRSKVQLRKTEFKKLNRDVPI